MSHVYVDELPDTDPAQIDLLSTVAGGGAHLVAFADPDSSTFAFRGADPAIVGRFPHAVPHGGRRARRTVTLHDVLPRRPALLAATRRVAARLGGPARHRLIAPASGRGSRRSSRSARSARRPASRRTWRTGCARRTCCTACRGRGWRCSCARPLLQLAPLQRALQQAGVPTVTRSEELPLQPSRRWRRSCCCCAARWSRTGSTRTRRSRCCTRRWAGPTRWPSAGCGRGCGRWRWRPGTAGRPACCSSRRCRTRPSWPPWSGAGRGRPATVAALLALARAEAARPESTVEDVLWAVWPASGLADRWAAQSARGGPRGEAADRDLDAVVVLFDAAARFVDRLPGARTEVFLDHVYGQELPSDAMAPVADRGEAVRILTAHAAKGLEWDVVAVAGVQEGLWPDLRLRGSVLGSETLVDVAAGRNSASSAVIAALLDEERRLFYVAATRAREQLLVTAVVVRRRRGAAEPVPRRAGRQRRRGGSPRRRRAG